MTKQNATPENTPEAQQPEQKIELQPQRLFLSKILDIMSEVGSYVQKDKYNKEQKYSYVSEAAVLHKIQPALCKYDVVCIPSFKLVSSEDKITQKGSTWKLITVEVTLKLIDADTGQNLEVVALGQGIDPNDKALAKAQTQAFKYAWWKLLCLETGDDPEADPITDAQQFSNPQQAPVQTTQTPELAVALGESPMGELLKMWNFAGWNAADLPNYVLKRLDKSSLDNITPSEYSSVINDLAAYMQGLGMKVTVIPF